MLTNLVSCLAIILVVVSLSGCGESGATDPTPSAQDAIKEKLTANKWNLQTAMVDGTDKTAVYQNLSITFTASSYSSTNGGSIWPATGAWSFNSVDGTSIKRDDGLVITVDVTSTSLKLSFAWSKNTLSGGKIESVSGQHVLQFVK